MEYVDTKDRTFETRVKFIKEIFTNKFAQAKILTSSVNYKLLTILEQLQQAYDKSITALSYENPEDILETAKE